jgi:Zn finger protein HypA/HybF involved in hydrogenase expression
MGLALSQSLAKAARGEKIEQGTSIQVDCPEGHGTMYEVQEGDRLHVLDAVMEVRKEVKKERRKE